MSTIQVKAVFPEGQFAFYQPPKIGKEANIGRRVKDGDTVNVYYDKNHPLEDVIDENDVVIKKGQLAKWMRPIGALPKKKVSKKKVVKK